MIRKYHNHLLQTNPRHRWEESQNINSHNPLIIQFVEPEDYT